MSWFKLLKDKESMAFGTEEGVQIGMEDDRYFEECCEDAKDSYVREFPGHSDWVVEADCATFRFELEERANHPGKSPQKTILEAWDKCEETKHTHRSANI